jgi:putative copper export protein
VQPDTISVILRSASFVAVFQAAGMAVFLALFGRPLGASLAPMLRITQLSVVAAALLLAGQYALEAARMAGDMSGLIDPSLQRMAMHSARSLVLAVRLLGLGVIAFAVRRRGAAGAAFCIVGAVAVSASFMLTGHTVAHPQRWVLAPLLAIHVMIVAFWFGALVPLYLACRHETPAVAGQVTQAFSKIALWLVPGIFAAGCLLVLALVRDLAEFRAGYGISLLAKFAGFVLLMALAAANKWRFGPAIAAGGAQALTSFRRCLGAEYALICVVLSITAVMTTFYSPGSRPSL